MAVNDERRIPIVIAGDDGIPNLASINEALRQISENLYQLEGRVGPTTIRDDLNVSGGLNLTSRVDSTGAPSTPDNTTRSNSSIYFDDTKQRLMIGEGTSPFRPITNAVYWDFSRQTSADPVFPFQIYTTDNSLGKGFFNQEGRGFVVQVAGTLANNANSKSIIVGYANAELIRLDTTAANGPFFMEATVYRSGVGSRRIAGWAAASGVAPTISFGSISALTDSTDIPIITVSAIGDFGIGVISNWFVVGTIG